MPVARNGNVELNYEVHGDGEPLLLLQGLGYGIWGWWKQIGDLSRDHRLIVFDNRGVGGSSKVTEPYTVDDMADDAAAVLDAAGADSAYVAGISLGGLIAQSLAARYPDKVRRLVLISTTHGGPEAVPVPPETAAIMLDPGEDLTPEQKIRRNMPPAFRPGWVEAHPDEFDEIVALRVGNIPPWDAYVAQATAGGTADTTGLIGKIGAPTLIVHGTEDRVVPFGNAELLASKIAGAKVEVLSGAGHVVMIEEPDRLHGLIRGFCR